MRRTPTRLATTASTVAILGIASFGCSSTGGDSPSQVDAAPPPTANHADAESPNDSASTPPVIDSSLDTVDAAVSSSERDSAAPLQQSDSPDVAPAMEMGGVDSSAPDAALPPARDASPPVTGGDGGCPGVFCEDFEKGSLDPSIWSSQANGGQPPAVVESTVTAHGKYAVQFHANPNIESYDFILTKNAPAALHGHHFGRAYFQVTPKPPTQHIEYLFAGTSGFPKWKYLEVAGVGAAWQLTYVDLVNGGESYASGGAVTEGKFICLEWEFNDTPDQATVFVNGAQNYSRSSITYQNKSSGLVGGFTDFGFGYYDWHPVSYSFDIYYDDIVLDTKRVGCLPN